MKQPLNFEALTAAQMADPGGPAAAAAGATAAPAPETREFEPPPIGRGAPEPDSDRPANFGSILRIPVMVQVVLGSATMPVANLMKLGRGAVIPLDHRVGEPVDVVVNGRVVARGEVVVVEDDNSRFGVSLTEIVGPTTVESGN
jgi:flagellar motor switch protein FliN